MLKYWFVICFSALPFYLFGYLSNPSSLAVNNKQATKNINNIKNKSDQQMSEKTPQSPAHHSYE